MGYTDEDVNWVYDRTEGSCFYCRIRLSFRNYGIVGNKGAWEIDHFGNKNRVSASLYKSRSAIGQ